MTEDDKPPTGKTMVSSPAEGAFMMSPAEVADLYGVDVRTVTRWDKEGKMPKDCVKRTPGGHRRYIRSIIVKAWLGESE